MKPEAAWRELAPFLDEVLELEPGARQAWLDAVAAGNPAIAANIGSELARLEELDRRTFLHVPVSTLFESPSLAGRRFGAYTLERMIGHGGMGTVWLARRSDGRFEGEAAVKLLNTALVGHPSERRFVREGSVLATLRHPNIAHLLDAGVAEGTQPYLILEYIRGEPIDQYCNRCGLDTRRRIKLFLDVLGAVAHAHGRLVVHRDLKPANILVTDEGTVKLLDFGVAALLSPSAESASDLTHHIAPGLTPGYAAPEQLLGEPVTTATDVYSLGIVLFVLLTGRHPMASDCKSTAELMRRTLETEAPRASQVVSDPATRRVLRGDLDNVIATALRADAAERYSSADHFAQDLRRWLAWQPVAARPRSSLYVASKFARRHRAAVAVAISILVVLIGAIVLTSRQAVEARRQRDQARYQSHRVAASVDFLTQLMRSDSGPSGRIRSFHQRLDLGVEMLTQQYGRDPRFAGRLLVDLAEYYRNDGNTTRANQIYAQAYAMGSKDQDAELMVAAQCGRATAEAYANINEGTVERIEEANQLLQRMRNPDPMLQVECLTAQAIVKVRQEDDAAAVTLLRRAMTVVQEVDGKAEGPKYAALLADLGTIYFQRNRMGEALRMEQRAAEIQDLNGRSFTSARLLTRQNTAMMLAAMGEVSAALRQREIIDRQLRDIESPEEAPLTFDLNHAVLLVRLDRPSAALQILGNSVSRARKDGNPAQLARSLLVTGAAHTRLGHWDAAQAALTEAAAISAGGIGDRNSEALSETLIADLELARGNLESARQHVDRSLALAGHGTPKSARVLPRVLLTAARVAFSEHAWRDSERFASDALAMTLAMARGPDTSADVGEALLRLSQARRSLDAQADVVSMLGRAARCLTNGLGQDHPLTIEARTLLTGVTADAACAISNPASHPALVQSCSSRAARNAQASSSDRRR